MIRLWDAATGGVLHELAAHQSGAACVALTPDGALVAAGGADGRIHLWDAATGKPKGDLPGHAGGVTALAVGCNGLVLASAGRDGAVYLWDLERRKELKLLRGHTGAVLALAFAPDSRTAASGGEDQTVRLWDVVAGQERSRLRGHAAAVTALAFSPDGATLATGGWGGAVRQWSVADGKPLRQLLDRGGGVRAVAYSPDGRRLVAGGGRALRQWSADTGRPWPVPVPPGGVILSAALAPDGTTLAVGGTDGLIRLWDLATGEERGLLDGHRGPVVALAFGPGGRVLASASTAASVHSHPIPARSGDSGLTPLPAAVAKVADPDRLWDDLAAADPRQALAAVRTLADRPLTTLALLRSRLRPVAPAPAAQVERWIADFLRADPAAQAKADAELLRLGELAEPALARAADAAAGPGRERIENLRARIQAAPPGPETLRGLRAVELLTRIGIPSARALLQVLAGGVPEAAVTAAAAAAAARLAAAEPGDEPAG